jgi:hypothetical protein
MVHCKHQPYNAVYGENVFVVRNIRTQKYYSAADMHRFLVFKKAVNVAIAVFEMVK